MSTLPTEPIRREHRELIPHLRHVEAASARVTEWGLDEARRNLPGIVEFLRDHLLPHAGAEEETLYPAVDRIQGIPTTATMTIDHEEIGERIGRLAAQVEEALADWDDRERVLSLSRQLAVISALVDVHFRKEEEVFLPILDRGLSAEEGHALFERMGHTAHAHT